MEATTATTPATPPGAIRERGLWRRTWLVVGVILLTLFTGFVLWRGSGTVYYVVMAWFLALAMEPAVARLTRWMPRAAATAVVLLGSLAAVVGFLAAFGGLLVSQLTELVQATPDIAESALARANELTGSSYTYEELLEQGGITPGDIAGYADDLAFGVLGVLTTVLSGAFGVFVLLFFAFYTSAGMPALRQWIASRMQPSLQVPFLAAWDLTRIKVGGYIAARIVLASINAVLSGVVFAAIGLPFWLPLALWTGIIAQFIPNIGTYVSIALPVVVGLTSGDPLLGLWVLVWGIAYQQVENLFVEPRISARAVNLHPAVSFGAALLGTQLFGLSGALLGVPVAATVMAMLEIYKRRYELTDDVEERVVALVTRDATHRSHRAGADAESSRTPGAPTGADAAEGRTSVAHAPADAEGSPMADADDGRAPVADDARTDESATAPEGALDVPVEPGRGARSSS
ncbi:MAG: AI-2E family transporter [Dermatophilaceae bacterium]